MSTTATFRLLGDRARTAADVTRRLGIGPTAAGEAGEPVSPRSRAVRTDSLWCSSSSPAGTEAELATHLRQLLDVLEPRRAELSSLARDGYRADWFCMVVSHATEHAVELDRDLLSRLLTLPGELLLDVSGDDR
ncbi:DUF4279 domain-containing protein [Amycolatopsis sp. NBC_00355]|uniref:DUF4279 domain-containing protein n=1 Tax=Amycolatopsis sp. NBC_00355 TaxID=2975957 RepID=UPI002E26ABE9